MFKPWVNITQDNAIAFLEIKNGCGMFFARPASSGRQGQDIMIALTPTEHLAICQVVQPALDRCNQMLNRPNAQPSRNWWVCTQSSAWARQK